ncbi:hypothetical protein CYLTODRAFT_488200 [Cylindrobasidium torrendii FP15055 ss-10]|uniref:Borealin C-terminal domain-containing protein n=1 Tax=Cylindrobasidium torrendii FP15055 ss-10 TaxID=1314674 RepID=A0A0D7BJ79_9AGAR|nr:hypothetical protein CYLTODRAFT_488200 [Cylindrobasidium torrendii FP15055 ss-10]
MSFFSHARPKRTEIEKDVVLFSFDQEVEAHRERIQSYAQNQVESFERRVRASLDLIIPDVRALTMREFGQKYRGIISDATIGTRRERLLAAGMSPFDTEIDRKRKRIPTSEQDSGGESARAPKNARIMALSPHKAGSSTGPGTAQRASLYGMVRTPGKARVPSSPAPKPRPPFNAGPSKVPARPSSPSKVSTSRVPSSSTFAPSLPPKTPAYPPKPSAVHMQNTLRMPKMNESMLSINGSPLANPFQFGTHWAAINGEPHHGHARTQSNITISRDPPPAGSSSRTASQTMSRTSSDTSESQTQPDTPPQLRSSSQPLPGHLYATPQPLTRSYSVTVPTKDGRFVEFDPFQTSPSQLDEMHDLSFSAKKQVRERMREEMGRLVAAGEKWKL